MSHCNKSSVAGLKKPLLHAHISSSVEINVDGEVAAGDDGELVVEEEGLLAVLAAHLLYVNHNIGHVFRRGGGGVRLAGGHHRFVCCLTTFGYIFNGWLIEVLLPPRPPGWGHCCWSAAVVQYNLPGIGRTIRLAYLWFKFPPVRGYYLRIATIILPFLPSAVKVDCLVGLTEQRFFLWFPIPPRPPGTACLILHCIPSAVEVHCYLGLIEQGLLRFSVPPRPPLTACVVKCCIPNTGRVCNLGCLISQGLLRLLLPQPLGAP